MSAIILTKTNNKIWGHRAYFLRNAKNVPGSGEMMGHAWKW